MLIERILRLGCLPLIIGVALIEEGSYFQFLKNIPCIFQYSFGIECFGCGITRAIIFLLKGDLMSSINTNALAFPVLMCFLAVFMMEINNIRKRLAYDY
jgi:hypothetical protein